MGTVISCNPEHYLDTALDALSTAAEWRAILDDLPVPIYTTDIEGGVTYWNRPCVNFAGREPRLGQDRWCVTWRIYTTTGEFMPHDQCPMADAIRGQRVIRDVVAIAERPDGSRVAFQPYPTPLFDGEGNMTGAVNMLVDVTREQSEALTMQAERCRRLADAVYNRETSNALASMAERFDHTAAELKVTRSAYGASPISPA